MYTYINRISISSGYQLEEAGVLISTCGAIVILGFYPAIEGLIFQICQDFQIKNIT